MSSRSLCQKPATCMILYGEKAFANLANDHEFAKFKPSKFILLVDVGRNLESHLTNILPSYLLIDKLYCYVACYT